MIRAPACKEGVHVMLQQHSDATLQPFVERLTRRSVLSAREQQAIMGLPVRAAQVETNEDFVRLGDQVYHSCFVLAGLVGRFDQSSEGARQITALHIPGDMPDLHSVVQPTATSALQALCTTTILRVPHEAIRIVAAKHPAIAEAFWRDTMVDSMILAQWIVNIGRRNATSRIAHLLCEMAYRFEAEPLDNQVVYDLRMTQTHLADATGLTPVHVNRCLGTLAKEGTTSKWGKVRIRDWKGLMRIADFDPAYLQLDTACDQRIRIVQ